MVGRSRSDASWHSRESAVPSPREVVVALNAHGGTSEGESVCRFSAGSLTDTAENPSLARKRTRAVHDGRRSGSFECALLTGRSLGGSDSWVKAERPVTSRAVS